MKKLTIFSGIAAAALAIAGCQKPEIETVVPGNGEGSTFELYAEIAQTKTTLDANYEVAWEEGDIIYMVTSDGKWGVPYAQDNTTASIATFTYAGGKFTTTATIADGNYTFNAVYSNGEQMSYHRSDVTTNQLYATQTQDCSAPTDHIKAYDALVGTFTANVPLNEPATVNMKHLYTLMQVDIMNATGSEIEITKFEMTAAGAKLAGIFYVDAFDTPAIAIKSGASESITVNVTGGTVAAGGSLPVYFVMAPLADYSGDVTFKVTDSKGNTYSKTVKMNGISFAAGKYNTTTYTITKADAKEPATSLTYTAVSNVASFTDGMKAIIVAKYADAYYYLSPNPTVSNGKIVGTEIEVNNDNIVTDQSIAWTFNKSGDYWIITDATKNLYHSNGGNSGTNLSYGTSTSYPWSISTHDESKKLFKFAGVNNSTVKTRGMLMNDQHQFGGYALSNINANTYAAIMVFAYNANPGETPEPEQKTLASIAVSNEKTEYYVGEEFVKPTVTATYDDASTADVTNSAEFSGYNMEVAGDQTVMVSYTEEGITKTAQYGITVKEAPAEPIVATVEEFLDAVPSTVVWYQLTGTISNISNTDYGNFDLTDGTGSVYVYGLTSAQLEKNDKSFASLGLKEGDIVTLIGNVGEYNANKQVANAYHVSSEKLAAWDAPEIVCSNNKVTITAEAGVSVYYTTNGETPSPSSTLYGEAFEINSSITVKAIAVADGRPQSIVAEKLCDYVDLSDQPATIDATLTFDDKAKRTVFTDNQQVWTENNITLTNDKGSSTNNVADYAKPARFYKSSKITVEAPGKITQIVFDCNSSYATALKNSITSGGTVTVSSDKVTVVLTTPAESFVISSLTGGQVRMDALTVTYIAD